MMQIIAKAETSKLAVYEYRCQAGPSDRSVPEMHNEHSISYVRRGSFGYVAQGKPHELITGSLLIGRPGLEYSCTHEHHAGGDECLSFKFTPEGIEEIGANDEAWEIGAAPPLPEIMVIGELAQAVAEGSSTLAFDEVALMLAAIFVRNVRGTRSAAARIRPHHRRRAIDIARWIEASSNQAVDLDSMARAAGMGSFHLLRTFSRVLGLTPHQYLIRSRLRHAARLLTHDDSAVTQIAAMVGFGDLSNFVRTFHRAAGMSPQQFRRRSRAG
ncbi:MAG TPA: AraC family transcriptional regulator [Steroidobacteraceae bacterium]|nr:AraC family transcriptional regulator [Steroidobacteraceae bacterium]